MSLLDIVFTGDIMAFFGSLGLSVCPLTLSVSVKGQFTGLHQLEKSLFEAWVWVREVREG
jgi:hypothetical protein